MGRHSKDRSGPTATDKALLVAGAVLVVIVVVVSVVVAITLGTGGDGSDTAEPRERRTPTTSATPTASPTPSAATSTPPAATPRTSAPARPAAEPPTLAFQVVGAEAWIRVSSGDRILLSGTFTEGQRRAFNQPEVTVRLGNAGNVRLVVNGRPRPLGEPGQIEELTVRRG